MIEQLDHEWYVGRAAAIQDSAYESILHEQLQALRRASGEFPATLDLAQMPHTHVALAQRLCEDIRRGDLS